MDLPPPDGLDDRVVPHPAGEYDDDMVDESLKDASDETGTMLGRTLSSPSPPSSSERLSCVSSVLDRSFFIILEELL